MSNDFKCELLIKEISDIVLDYFANYKTAYKKGPWKVYLVNEKFIKKIENTLANYKVYTEKIRNEHFEQKRKRKIYERK